MAAVVTAGTEMPVDRGATTAIRPPLAGWLLKKKSENARGRFICSTNKRYFTLDFEGQHLYYAHTESKKNCSQPIFFTELIGVEPFSASISEENADSVASSESIEGSTPTAEAAVPPIQRSNSKGSLTSSFRVKMPNFRSLSKSRPTERHGFLLKTSGKSMELLCTSKAEADEWIAALQEAMAMAGHKRVAPGSGLPAGVPSDELGRAELSTQPGSSRRTSPGGSRASTPVPAIPEVPEAEAAEAAPATASSQTNSRSAGYQATNPPQARESESPPKETVLSPTAQVAVAEAREALAEENPEEKKEAAKEAAKEGGKRRAFGLLPPRPPKMEKPTASATKVSESSADSPEAESPPTLESTVAMEVGGLAEASTLDAGGDAWGHTKTSARGSNKYADKGAGLSLQERLEQLNFSDDEDEDDEEEAEAPSCTRRAAKEWTVATGADAEELCVIGHSCVVEALEPASVEACETIEAPAATIDLLGASSDDE
eukprot:gnl/TRDRNA2_/TRDRNA2_185199_c0_seq1.p1 gnl/TRDRNA2_/TRDRNA2_185199_c0~~gnl/TRDRNA2_/TRDRNA2_185199_c0_seq1.p1  ORF type:complete len:499 (+),score=128.58 gnl/TRDRNA2_/TRDRNA2_185199_c0_seq1:36-1499(+)